MVKKKTTNKNKESQLDNLEQIKRLLIMALIRQGVPGSEIADVLGLDQSTISRMVPTRRIKKK